jgi:hypothetical protein
VRHLASRDRFINWNAEIRQRNLYLMAHNSRFLVLPRVTVPHLASHILGRTAKLVPRDWQPLYAHPIYWLETFVDHHKPAGQRTSKAAFPGHGPNGGLSLRV